MNYKAVVSSAMMALLISGCTSNDKQGANENLGLNRNNQDNYDTPMRVSDTRQNDNNLNDNNLNDNINDNGTNDLRVSEDISNRVEALKEVKNAWVIVTDHHAYVGAELNDGADKDLTNELKDRIADSVRGADSSVEKVYVSTNPDFVQRMNDYVTDINNGKPVKGFVDEFRDLVTRIFPSSE
ncbi:YhcN/YlaJ family sporulation lipoprotein [Peribacillus sp. TH16]|uniref:YhcN/YlaJ family sporulation lipoprotein n=1 Tax=unclassified Peribacillus TaxID=2675266 RepID=UPI00191426F9|nr:MULTISPECIES: YhcN/YlaJ family sporulation lipoprotein [unclassified Peribacillus]MBK5485261.1 YhcN/YlaJ family sporulation lipoprotein [Peribacillus sp. TH16]WMX55355.1 YhcN/YlaJ family sporulation lipoprotein [Peribacillus sp. R9-11]